MTEQIKLNWVLPSSFYGSTTSSLYVILGFYFIRLYFFFFGWDSFLSNWSHKKVTTFRQLLQRDNRKSNKGTQYQNSQKKKKKKEKKKASCLLASLLSYSTRSNIIIDNCGVRWRREEFDLLSTSCFILVSQKASKFGGLGILGISGWSVEFGFRTFKKVGLIKAAHFALNCISFWALLWLVRWVRLESLQRGLWRLICRLWFRYSG